MDILIGTWDNGLHCFDGKTFHQELADKSVRSLVADGQGGVLAIVEGRSVCRRVANGAWTAIAKSDLALSCCVPLGSLIFVGTDDARILRVDADGAMQSLTSFDTIEGRDKWYAGTAIVDGKIMGPPLGIRSMAATCDGAVLLANVHVGGIPRSTDAGATWRPTIDIESDVHQVCAHPTRPGIVIAASAAGLCLSRDAGATWTVEQRGLHASHCSGVAFGQNDILISASTDPLRHKALSYTDCIATRDSTVAVIDASGCLYVSHDDGAAWSYPADRITNASGLYIC